MKRHRDSIMPYPRPAPPIWAGILVKSRKRRISREYGLHGLPRQKMLIEKRLDGGVRARNANRRLVIRDISGKAGK
jgi:hypothetical protein